MDRFYEDADSLFVQAYDAFAGRGPREIEGDVAFYQRLANEAGGPALELACGTGRATLAMATAGLDVTGADMSEGMLSVARAKAEALSQSDRDRITWVAQNMATLDLGNRFGFCFVAFRSFQHLLTIDRQRETLQRIRRHLAPEGRLALHLFDPRLEFLVDEDVHSPDHEGTDPATGRRYFARVLRTRFDHVAQIRRDLWRYAEIGPDDAVLREQDREMVLRWTYRWELHHLLALCGFAVEAEFSDFLGSPPAYGRELIVVARSA